MKKEYVNEDKDNHSSMFAQLPQPNSADVHHPNTFLVPSTAAANNPQQPSEEIGFPIVPSSVYDGATIEKAFRRPRGRPPGSKNKPKPPVIITHVTKPSMRPYVLELPAGIDITETIVSFCRKRNTDLCILNGSGTVTNVTLRQPSTDPGASVTFHGRFDVLSLSATILAGNLGVVSSGGGGGDGGIANGFTISFAGSQGQVVGGVVVGPLYSAGTVYLIAATFNTPMFQRLPLEEDEGNYSQQSPVSGGGGDSVAAVVGGREIEACDAGEVGLYNLPADVIWAPTPTQPPQHPPPPSY